MIKTLTTSLIVCWLCASALAARTTDDRLNVVFILIDDMGWKDPGCYGGELFETPNIDRLAAQGMRFTDAYAACSVCAPTRASLVTGKYPGRLHFTALTGHQEMLGNVEHNPTGIKLIQPAITREDGVQPDEFCIAEAFRAAGYRTALFGKTHFGSGHENLHAMGFDVAENPQCDMWVTPPAVVEDDPKRMTTITDRSIEFMRECADRDRPFFLYVPHKAVHVQFQATREYYEQYAQKLTPEEKEEYSPYYLAMVEELDREVGRLLDELERLGVADRTAVFFTSDNGGVDTVYSKTPYPATSMAPLRGQKGGQYEGSHRVPLIVRWPGHVRPGSVSHEVVITPDFYPTCLDMAGLPGHPGQHLDGISMVPALRGGELEREAVYWHKPHYYTRNGPLSVIRCGRYKYIHYWETELSPAGGPPHQLFDLEQDIGETDNLVREKPEIADRLRKMLMAHLEEVDAELPEVNPRYGRKETATEREGAGHAARDDWKKVDDFESYAPGESVAGRDGWRSADDSLSCEARVVADPDGTGKVLRFRKTGARVGVAALVHEGSGFIARTLSAPQTLTLRFRFTGHEGLKGAAEEYVGFGVTADAGIDRLPLLKQGFTIRDADDDQEADQLASPAGKVSMRLRPDTWYRVWLITDNKKPDTARLYMQSGDDPRFADMREVPAAFDWISGPGARPYPVIALIANHASGPAMYVDDIYFDNHRANLAPPPADEARGG
ncbi:sulfatase [Kiritimatiella glycovorans]|uniref:Arylsulfatase n=1 Tax=Kiritimatiella glycovorans TaxID=1307763 RepID=A0A0G3EAY6_9BACT|nr:sulfatase [Kiritimatiella glycovorans]AKJ63651.1 Arylsulfatase [Kiritimatiella glycovorans]